MFRQILAFALLPLIASCVAPREAAPAAPPRPAAAPRPAAPAPAPTVAERYAGDWSVADLGPGEWRFAQSGRVSEARYGLGQEATAVVLRCEGGQISIARDGALPSDGVAALNLRTSYAERRLPARGASTGGRMLSATLPASDPLWDQIIYSRGRFLIEATGQAPLIVPTRPEVARVVEDCRG